MVAVNVRRTCAIRIYDIIENTLYTTYRIAGNW